MADFRVRAYLKDDPETDLTKKIPPSGFIADAVPPVPPETDKDVFAKQMLDYFVSSGIITEDRRCDVIFDFE